MKPSRKRPVIGFLINSLTGTYPTRLLQGLLDTARQLDADFRIFPAGFPYHVEGYIYQYSVIYDWITNENIDALIIATGTIKIHQQFDDFLKKYNYFSNMPVISLSIALPGISSILVDNRSGIREAVEHLTETHHCRKIAFIQGGKYNEEAAVRFEAYKEGLAASRLEYDPSLVFAGDFTPESGRTAARELLKIRGNFDAVIASNDDMTFAVMEIFREAGLSLPEEIPVIGFDDVPEAEFSTPALTTIRQPLYKQASLAVEWAMRLISGKTVPSEVWLSTRLVIRRSCGCILPYMDLLDSPKVTQFTACAPDTPEEQTESLSHRISELLDEYISPADAQKISSEVICLFRPDSDQDQTTILKKLEALMNTEYSRISISHWQGILSRLYEVLYCSSPEIIKNARFQTLFQKARILIAEETRHAEGERKIKVQKDNDRLNEVILKMVRNLTRSDLVVALAEELPALGITSAFMVLYPEEIKHTSRKKWRFPEEGRLVLAYNEQGRVRLTEKNSRVNPGQILPSSLFPKKRRSDYFLLPLFFQNEHSGYILFEAGPRNGSLYETLRLQISSLLKIGNLFRERRRAEEELKVANGELEKSLEMQYKLNNALIESTQELNDVNTKLHQLSVTDGLTQLYNRRFFNEIYPKQFLDCRRLGNPIALLMIDIDHFKKINDTYGHGTGDICLVNTAKLIEKVLKRPGDMAARYGGEEFAVILPNTDLEGSSGLAEQIRRAVEKNPIQINGQNLQLTISIGCAVAEPENRFKPEELLSRADKALYLAKSDGRNLVRLAK